jgi:hypothetical protein
VIPHPAQDPLPPLVLLHKARSPTHIAAWHRRGGADENLHLPIRGNAQQAKTQPPAEVAKPRIALPPLSAHRQTSSQPNLVTCNGAVDALQKKFEAEAELQLADHEDRRVLPFERDNVATANLTFHCIPEALEEFFHGGIKRSLEPSPIAGADAIAWNFATSHGPIEPM